MLRIQHTPELKQPELFPVVYQGKMKTDGETRNRVGDRIEDLVCRCLGLTNIPINGNYDVNFDAGLYFKGNEIFFEIKSLRRGSKSPLYVCRLEKEKKAQEQSGKKVIYVFCVHGISGVKNQADITRMIISNPVNFYLLPLDEVIRITKDLPVKVISRENGLNGYNRKGYERGYMNLSAKSIRSVCGDGVEKTLNIFSSGKSFRIHCSKNLNVELPVRFWR